MNVTVEYMEFFKTDEITGEQRLTLVWSIDGVPQGVMTEKVADSSNMRDELDTI